MNRHHNLRLSALALAAAACLPAWSAPVISADSAAAAFDGTANVAGTPSTNTSPGYVNSITQSNQAQGTATGYAFANQFGAYAVNSSAEGKGNASAQAKLQYTLMNSSALAQSYTMSFYIYGGYLEAMTAFNGPGLSGSESLSAGYTASIKAGSNTVFSSGATFTRTDGLTTLVKTGTELSNASASASMYAWSGATYSIELGVLGAGESMDVLAQLDDMTVSDVGTYIYSGGGGYGYQCSGGGGYNAIGGMSTMAVALDDVTCFKGNARAFYGDPVDFDDQTPPTAVTFVGTAVGQVPEPGTLALVALALVAAATGRRRKHAAPA